MQMTKLHIRKNAEKLYLYLILARERVRCKIMILVAHFAVYKIEPAG